MSQFFTDTPEVAEGRAVRDAARARLASLDARLAAALATADPEGDTSRGVAAAIARDDQALASSLRAQRSLARAEAGDLAPARDIASDAADKADDKLARLEAPLLEASMRQAAADFAASVDEAQKQAARLQAIRLAYQPRLGAACRVEGTKPEDQPNHPKRIIGALPHLARAVFERLATHV